MPYFEILVVGFKLSAGLYTEGETKRNPGVWTLYLLFCIENCLTPLNDSKKILKRLRFSNNIPYLNCFCFS